MKTKKYIYQSAASIIIMLTAALFTGCLGRLQENAYKGSTLPKEEVAILRFHGLYPTIIDGNNDSWPHHNLKLGLPPGHHTITFYPSDNVPATSINTSIVADAITKDIYVEAGKEYQVKAIIDIKFLSLHGHWTVSITECQPIGKAEELILGH